MSERKTLTKYYPPDFDPSTIARARKSGGPSGPRVQTVRLMAPFSMKCTTCGEYIYSGRKFNARKETPPDEKYLGNQIFRFYIRCTRCSAEITFRTDPKTGDYTCERGAKRNTEPWRQAVEETDDERLDRLEREEADEAERNAMVELEAKTVDAKREMAVADALDEIRTRNARMERADRDGVEVGAELPADDDAARQEKEDAEAARLAFASSRLADVITVDVLDDGYDDDDDAWSASTMDTGTVKTSTTSSSTAAPSSTAASQDMPPPSFKRVAKKKKNHSALLGIKKKPALV